MAVKRRKDNNGRVLPDGVTQRKDGRYLYRTQENGKPVYIYDQDLNVLKEKIKKYNADKFNGVNLELSKMTLNEWMDKFFTIYKKDNVKEGSYLSKVSAYENNVRTIGTLGSMKIKDIKRIHIIAHAKLLVKEKNIADSTLKQVISILHDGLQQLVYDKEIQHNPVERISQEVKGKESKERVALEEDEVKTLIDFLQEDVTYNIYLPMIVVALATGLRAGELLALTWDSIDFERKKLYVDKNMQYNKISGGKREHYITSVKTKNGKREIPLSNDVIRMFHMQMKYQREMRIRNDVEISGYSGFIFTTKNGTPFTGCFLNEICNRITKAANLWEEERAEIEQRDPVYVPKHSPHIWRYTFCTRLVEAEMSYMTLKKLMGHSRVQTSIDIYTSISERIKEKNAESMEDIFKFF